MAIKLSRAELEEYHQLLEEKLRRERSRKIFRMYPETGPLSRHNYPKHMKFFEMGLVYSERAAIAANRVGKTEGMGGYELVWHLTGLYPEWWPGKRFDRAVKCWAAGTTNQKTKEILQEKLCGPISDIGTGLIPGDCIVDYKKKASSVPDVIETVYVKHTSGDTSIVVFKSYEQGRTAFEGTEQDVVLLDEEPPEDVYEECLTRTMTTKGIIMLTFTPLQGVSKVVMKFMPGGIALDGPVPAVDGGAPIRYLVSATWDDAPHLDEGQKRKLWAGLEPHLRDARSKGIPSLGSGAIYPILESEITVDDFEIPPFWPRAYGFDVGWNCTAAVWGAVNPETQVCYLYSCYSQGQNQPVVHVAGIKSRGSWIPGCSDPGARAGSQRDGEKLLDEYRDLGLNLVIADNSVEAGIFDVWILLSTGKLKIFKSLAPWLEEFRIYHRDELGRVVKVNDHLMDATRYWVRTGRRIAQLPPTNVILAALGANTTYDPLRYGL
jgi:phage terminase large subunit-like protein